MSDTSQTPLPKLIGHARACATQKDQKLLVKTVSI